MLVMMAIARAAFFIAHFSLSDASMQKKIERPMVAKALHERKRKSQQREYRKKQTPFSFMSLRRMFEDERINVSMRTILTHFLFEFKTYCDTLALLGKNMIPLLQIPSNQ